MSSKDISWGELGWYSWSIAITFMMSLSVILFQLGCEVRNSTQLSQSQYHFRT
jgi:hypothetical protein